MIVFLNKRQCTALAAVIAGVLAGSTASLPVVLGRMLFKWANRVGRRRAAYKTNKAARHEKWIAGADTRGHLDGYRMAGVAVSPGFGSSSCSSTRRSSWARRSSAQSRTTSTRSSVAAVAPTGLRARLSLNSSRSTRSTLNSSRSIRFTISNYRSTRSTIGNYSGPHAPEFARNDQGSAGGDAASFKSTATTESSFKATSATGFGLRTTRLDGECFIVEGQQPPSLVANKITSSSKLSSECSSNGLRSAHLDGSFFSVLSSPSPPPSPPSLVAGKGARGSMPSDECGSKGLRSAHLDSSFFSDEPAAVPPPYLAATKSTSGSKSSSECTGKGLRSAHLDGSFFSDESSPAAAPPSSRVASKSASGTKPSIFSKLSISSDGAKRQKQANSSRATGERPVETGSRSLNQPGQRRTEPSQRRTESSQRRTDSSQRRTDFEALGGPRPMRSIMIGGEAPPVKSTAGRTHRPMAKKPEPQSQPRASTLMLPPSKLFASPDGRGGVGIFLAVGDGIGVHFVPATHVGASLCGEKLQVALNATALPRGWSAQTLQESEMITHGGGHKTGGEYGGVPLPPPAGLSRRALHWQLVLAWSYNMLFGLSAFVLLVMLLLGAAQTGQDAEKLRAGGLSHSEWWRSVSLALCWTLFQSLVIVDGAKVLMLAITPPVFMYRLQEGPFNRVLCTKLLRQMHRLLDIVL